MVRFGEDDLKNVDIDKNKLIKEKAGLSGGLDETEMLKSLFVTQADEDDALDEFEKEKDDLVE